MTRTTTQIVRQAAGQPAPAARPIRIGARRSPLAVAQAEWVADQLRAAGHRVEIVGIVSQGDVDHRRLTEIGGVGVFAAAVRRAMLECVCDVVVHSLKDLPVAPAPGLVLVAVPAREDARDVLVGLPVEQWSDDTVVGTGSPRREMQLRELAASRGVHPTFLPVRGNVDTRIDLVRNGIVHATVLAAAGLRRLGRLTGGDSPTAGGLPAQVLGLDQVVPAAGQGALAIECPEDLWCRDALAALEDADARAAVTAERQFLATLEAGCLTPIGAHATISKGSGSKDSGEVTLQVAAATTVDEEGAGGSPLHDVASGPASSAADVGRELATRVLARMPAIALPGTTAQGSADATTAKGGTAR